MKRGQVWVETVIYTLIGIAIIGIVLAVAKPKIDQKKDEIAIDQAIESLSKINEKIYAVRSAVGNRRSIELKISSGEITFDETEDKIIWELKSRFEYSEEGVTIPVGNINVTTTRESGNWKVSLESGYPIEIESDIQTLAPASIPYQLTITNNHTDITSGKHVIIIKKE